MSVEKAAPEIYMRQKKFAEEAIAPEHRHGMITTLSANRYGADQSKAMSAHSDGKDRRFWLLLQSHLPVAFVFPAPTTPA